MRLLDVHSLPGLPFHSWEKLLLYVLAHFACGIVGNVKQGYRSALRQALA